MCILFPSKPLLLSYAFCFVGPLVKMLVFSVWDQVLHSELLGFASWFCLLTGCIVHVFHPIRQICSRPIRVLSSESYGHKSRCNVYFKIKKPMLWSDNLSWRGSNSIQKTLLCCCWSFSQAAIICERRMNWVHGCDNNKEGSKTIIDDVSCICSNVLWFKAAFDHV